VSRPRLAVIGGGLAGVSAALAAVDAGADVVLLERRSRLGGLTWSFRRHGLWFDNGQHVFMRCCTAYRGFLDRIGASDQVTLQPRLEVPVLAPGGISSSITRTNLPAPLHLLGSLARYRFLGVGERARLARAVLPMRHLDPDDPALDTITFGRWLAEHGQSGRAIERLWDLITLPTVNVPAAEASLAIAIKVFRTGLLDSTDGGDIGWSQVPLRQLHADNASEALSAAGVDVRLGSRVEGLARSADSGWVVSTPEGPDRVDAVIVATPPEVAATLVPEGTLPAIEGLGASPIVNVHLVLDRTVTDLPMAAGVGTPIQFLFDRTASSGVKDGQCLAISLSAADTYVGQRPEELVRSFRQALDDLLPSARHARLIDGTVSREHAATFRAVPGTAALRPSARTGLPGLAVAGAWCATGWPATMEGAVRSGQSAVSVVLDGVGEEHSAGGKQHSAGGKPSIGGKNSTGDEHSGPAPQLQGVRQ
jgi:squalene-associated FAD-dependent desaturase